MKTLGSFAALWMWAACGGGGGSAASDSAAGSDGPSSHDAHVADASSPDDITAFSIGSATGTITGTSIVVGEPFGTDVTHLTPTIAISGTSVVPASGTAEDFTSPVTYTVHAADGSTKAYTVRVAVGFAPRVDFTPGMVPIFVALGDLNGDGKLDVVTANRNSATVSVFLNMTATGARTPIFASKVDFGTGGSPLALAIADLDADGKPDLAVANSTGNTVSVLRNTMAVGATTATFATKVDYATGNEPSSIAIADIDRDGTPDLVTANYNASDVGVSVNTTMTDGTTTVPFATTYPFPTTIGPISVAAADLNGDGKPDLVATSLNNDKASVLLNTTAGGAIAPSFATKVDLSTGDTPSSIAIGDLNGDGKPDLAISDQTNATLTGGTISIFFNTMATNATTATFATKVELAAGSDSLYVAEGELTGDGKPDLAVLNQGASSVSVFANTTTASATTPSFAASVDYATGGAPQCVAIGDLNGDGKADLAVVSANINNDTLSILLAY